MDVAALVNVEDGIGPRSLIEERSFVLKDYGNYHCNGMKRKFSVTAPPPSQNSEDNLVMSLFMLRDGEKIDQSSSDHEVSNEAPGQEERSPHDFSISSSFSSLPSSPNSDSNSDSFSYSGSSGGEDEPIHQNKKIRRTRKEKKIPWNEHFKKLSNIVHATGKMPSFQTKNVVLWRWLDTQCDLKNQGVLSDNLVSKLAGLGFDFIKSDFKKAPKKNHKKRFPLSSWIHAQRTQYRKGKLSNNRIELLNKLGFVWEPMKVNGLEAESNQPKDIDSIGICTIPESLIMEFALSPQAIQREQIWIENFEKLREFKQKYGHLRVPTDEISARDYFEEE